METTVTQSNFKREVLESDKTVLLDFWATWCGPCRMIAPVLEELAAERPDIKIGKVNVDEQMKLAMDYRVASIPTLMVFKNGKRIATSVGYMEKAEIIRLLESEG